MGHMNRARLLLCGLVTGGIYIVLSALLLTVVGGEFLAAVTGDRQVSPPVYRFLFCQAWPRVSGPCGSTGRSVYTTGRGQEAHSWPGSLGGLLQVCSRPSGSRFFLFLFTWPSRWPELSELRLWRCW